MEQKNLNDKMGQIAVEVPNEISDYIEKRAKETGKRFKSAYMRDMLTELISGERKFDQHKATFFNNYTKEGSKRLSFNVVDGQDQFVKDMARDLRMSKNNFIVQLICQDMEAGNELDDDIKKIPELIEFMEQQLKYLKEENHKGIYEVINVLENIKEKING